MTVGCYELPVHGLFWLMSDSVRLKRGLKSINMTEVYYFLLTVIS